MATARPDVTQVEVDGEIVLYDDTTNVMHRLNPTAGQVWHCLDGSGSLAEIAADLAEVYAVDPQQVLTEVVATVRQFGSAGLLVEVGDALDGAGVVDIASYVQPEDPDSPFVPEPYASGMDGAFPLDEAGKLTVKAGPYLLGLRFSTPEMVEMAREVLAPSLVEGVVAPPNVSVKVTAARGPKPLYFCYRSTTLTTRARSPRRALVAAVNMLSTYVPCEGGALRLLALTAIRGGQAVLFCPESRMEQARLLPRLHSTGWEVLDAPDVDLDLSGRVVVAPLAVSVDAAALAALAASRADGSRPAAGRYPVVAWVAVRGDEPMPETMAGRVALVTANAPGLDADSAPEAFEITAAMLRGARWVVSPSLTTNDLVAALTQAVP